MKPRVLIVIDTYNIGGPGKGLIQFLTNGGLELCQPVLAGFWRGPERAWQFRDAAELTGVQFEVLKQRHGFDPSVIKEAIRLVRENNITILQSHGYKAHVICYFVRLMTKLPWVAFVHGWTSENIKVKAYNLIDKVMVRFADRIVPVSVDLKKRLHLSSACEKKVRVISNAVDTAKTDCIDEDIRKKYDIGCDDFLIGVVGRLSPEKGHVDFILAMKLMVITNPLIKAIFVGEGQERLAIETAIRENALQGCIFMAGYQQDVSAYYRAFDLVVMPSHAEGMPNAALEAMVHAKPVVATRVGGIPEVVVDGVTGCLVPPRNPEALSEAILVIASNSSMMAAFGVAGKDLVSGKFNPQERAKNIVAVYHELLGSVV